MKKNPLVSIVLPVYKSEKYLSDCLKSLLSQTHKAIEVIAIDDFSSDNSHTILKKFAKRDKRVRVYKNKKRYGIAITLNRAVKRARGKFIAFMSHNDIASKDRIQQELKFLLENPKIAGVGAQARFLDKKHKRVGNSAFPHAHEDMKETLLAGLSLQPETIMINRSALPIDILKFKHNSYPFVYTEVFIKCIQYAQFANLPSFLQYHRKTLFTTPGRKQIVPSLIKSWIKATTLDYTPSIKALLLPFFTSQSNA